ncbi:hypothetical protein C1646_776928 [Rhizophagus diaphanus]|nr:hypothetical protein C1646_776928 [Rhizophagus diaphanus] [Rhizophagus sp. MUCL 43196]
MVGTGSKSPIVMLALTGVAGERLKQLQNRLKEVRYVIINEKRDFGQLPPIRDLLMYASTKRDALSDSSFAAYKQFKEAYKLNVVQRQSGNSKEQQDFRNILLRMRNGESTIDDWRTLDDINAVNIDQLRSLNVPIAKIQAIYTGGNEAKKANSDTAYGLEAQLLLVRGSCVMLTANLWIETGLVNGSMGTVKDILFKEDQRPPSLPIADGKSGVYSRLQIPVHLAWAITMHKSQGLTLQKAIIDLSDKEFITGLSFITISRVHILKDILFKPFNFERLRRIKECKRLPKKLDEEERSHFNIIRLEKNDDDETTNTGSNKAIDYIAEGWNNITQKTIQNCWIKTGILPTYNDDNNDDVDKNDLESDLDDENIEDYLDNLPNSDDIIEYF